MSDNETVKSAAASESCVHETPKSDQRDSEKSVSSIDAENAALPVIEKQNAIAPDIKPIDPSSADDGQTTEELKKKTNTEIAADNVKAAAESVKQEIAENTETPRTLEVRQNEQLSSVPENQQQSIGAGDTCFKGHNENGVAQKTDEKIVLPPVNDQASLPKEKLPVDDDKTANEDRFTISKLKEEVQKTIEERDSYRKKLEITEKRLGALQTSYDALLKGDGDEIMLRRMIEQLKGKLIQTSLQLEDRIRTVTNQEKQISALNSQVASLKEVESLTRSLLQIRNMEVKHLQAEVDDMEVKITEERERYNTMINKMDAAVKLNADLKKEYETQLCLFRDLREKYEEKVTLLTEEKRALENSAQSVPK